MREKLASLIHVTAPQQGHQLQSGAHRANSADDMEHIDTAMEFAKAWLKAWKASRNRDSSLQYNHIRALDYLACRILRAYLPEGICITDVQALAASVAAQSRAAHYKSVTQIMDARFLAFLKQGKPAHEFSDTINMQWRLADEAE